MTGRTRLCFQPWNTINVGADGSVYPCCVTTDDLVIGHISESSLEDIVTGPKMAAIRDQLMTGNLIGRCQSCQNAGMTSVKALHRALNRYLMTTAAEAERPDCLIMLDPAGQLFHTVGNVETSVVFVGGGNEEIEVHSGFSSEAYLEGRINLQSDLTIGLWVKWTASSEAGLILHYAAPDGGAWSGPVLEIGVSASPSNAFQIAISPDGYAKTFAIGAPSGGEGQWTHVTLTKAGDQASLFVNGEIAAEAQTFAGSLHNPKAILRVGVNNTPQRGSRFAGSIAGLFIEHQVLPSDIIGQVYRAEYPAFH